MTSVLDERQKTMAAVKAALAEHLQPLLPGTVMAGPFSGGLSPRAPVCYDTKHRLRVYAPPGRDAYFTFERTYPFSEDERLFMESIARDIHDAARATNAGTDAVAAACATRTVARHVAPGFPETLLRVINAYEAWAENKDGTAHATGIRPMRKGGNAPDFSALAEKGLFKAMGTSPDTLVVIDDSGEACTVEKMRSSAADSKRGQDIFAPVAHANIAAWAGSRGRVAARLIKDGSILLFGKGRLLFVKRAGRWFSMPHTLTHFDPVAEHIEGVLPETIQAVYLTALDLIPGRGKARIGLVRCERENRLPSMLRKKGIRLSGEDSSNSAKLLTAMTHSQKFHEMARAIRAEICASGRTVLLDGRGTILGLEACGSGGKMAEWLFSGKASMGGVFPGSAYMEFFNRDGQLNLHLAIG